MKPKFPREVAAAVAEQLRLALLPACERLIVAGSLRRLKPLVGDVEILYVPTKTMRADPADMFARRLKVNLADEAIVDLEERGVLARRKSVKGTEAYGPKNKLMRHVASGVPVDLFATTEDCWFNYLVCRTGPSESNIRIARAAQERGWQWKPYSAGFWRGDEVCEMHSEAEVFAFVGLPYGAPEERR